jgi:hypothetical protein
MAKDNARISHIAIPSLTNMTAFSFPTARSYSLNNSSAESVNETTTKINTAVKYITPTW